MKTKVCKIILAVITLVPCTALTAMAQTEHQHDAQKPSSQADKQGKDHKHQDMSKMDMSMMTNDPHHVLAMAYMQNLGTFAKALRDQAQASSALNADFARAAVAEIRRSFDEGEKHHQEHMQSMSEEMRSHMAGMMKDMDMHHEKLKDAVAALEKDVHAAQLNAKQVAADSATVLKHLDEMSKMHDDKKGKNMKMKLYGLVLGQIVDDGQKCCK